MRARTGRIGAAFAAVAVAGVVGAALGSGEATADQFTPSEQQLVRLLPPGYAAHSCARAANPFPNSIASLDCSQDANSDSPEYARFTLYSNAASMNADFDITAGAMMVAPCPDGNPSPGTWTYQSDSGLLGGRIVCGFVDDLADIAWTRDGQLLLATVNGGSDLDNLYQWWRRYGGA
ncbi:MAG: hypothetical protein ACLPXZ_00110 [Mycobacterium sp.]